MSSKWPEVRLGEVIREDREAVGATDGEELPVLGVTNIEGVTQTGVEASADRSKYLRLRPGRFVYNPYRINVGSIGLSAPSQNGICSPAYVVFASTERINPHFLRFFLKSAKGNQLINFHGNRGSVRSALRFDDLCKIEIPLPSMEEQQRILVRIEGLAAKIREAHALRHQSAEEAEQIMAAEEQRIWPNDALRDAKPLEAVTTFLARGRQSKQGESDHFLIKTQHVQQGRYMPTSLRLAPHVAAKVRPEGMVQNGDVLIACSAAGCLGRVARYQGEEQAASTDTHVAIARANPKIVDADYLYSYLLGSQGQYQLRSRERGDWEREKISFRLTELNLNDLKQVPVPTPSIVQQRQIVVELNALQAEVDALKRLQAETSAELDALLPSILDKAFKGEL